MRARARVKRASWMPSLNLSQQIYGWRNQPTWTKALRCTASAAESGAVLDITAFRGRVAEHNFGAAQSTCAAHRMNCLENGGRSRAGSSRLRMPRSIEEPLTGFRRPVAAPDEDANNAVPQRSPSPSSPIRGHGGCMRAARHTCRRSALTTCDSPVRFHARKAQRSLTLKWHRRHAGYPAVSGCISAPYHTERRSRYGYRV